MSKVPHQSKLSHISPSSSSHIPPAHSTSSRTQILKVFYNPPARARISQKISHQLKPAYPANSKSHISPSTQASMSHQLELPYPRSSLHIPPRLPYPSNLSSHASISKHPSSHIPRAQAPIAHQLALPYHMSSSFHIPPAQDPVSH